MDLLRERRELNKGFGDGLAKAFEFAITPAVFGFLGHLADRALGTEWVLMVLAFLVSVTGLFISTWYRYDAQMKASEADTPWGRAAAENAAGAAQPQEAA